MTLIFDLVFLLGLSAALFQCNRELSLVVFLVNLMFYFQLGQTLLLKGSAPKHLPLERKIKSGILSILIVLPILIVVGKDSWLESTSAGNAWSVSQMLGGKLYPGFLGICLLTAVSLASLFIEKRKR